MSDRRGTPQRRAPAIPLAGAFASILLTAFVGFTTALLGPEQIASAGPPSAQEGLATERVLIRIVPHDAQVAARLRAELGLLGLTAATLEVPDEAPPLGPDLLDRLDEGNASAAIEIAIGDERIDLWVADGNTGKALNRRLDLTHDPDQDDPRTLAIAAVELLRASRLELAVEGSGGEPDQPAPQPDPEQAPDKDPESDPTKQATENERPPRRVDLPSLGAISLAPMVGGSPGGFGVTTHVELAGRWAPLERFALRSSLWVPTLGNSVSTPEGNVRMFVGMAFVEPQLLLPGGAKWFHPELGLGLGGAVIGFVGNAIDDYRGRSRVLPGFASYGHFGLGFAVIPRLWIRLDGYVGVLLPRPQVFVLGERIATWGAPFATGTFGLEIWL